MDAVDRLYRRIVEALDHVPRDTRGVPVTIGEIYQTVVPYRAVRAGLGFAELAQYEHALLRLLAGERDYVQVERDEVREELQRELRAPNPILGLYRDYAGEAAFVNPRLVTMVSDPTPSPVADAAPAPSPAPASRPQDRPADGVRTAPVAVPAEPVAPPAPRPPQCSGCRTPLPVDRDVRFCPFCGKCLKPVPCPDCSSPVEPEWSFCAACGVPRPGVGGAGPERRLR